MTITVKIISIKKSDVVGQAAACVTGTSHAGALLQILAAVLPGQLPASVHGETAEGSSNLGASEPKWETRWSSRFLAFAKASQPLVPVRE